MRPATIPQSLTTRPFSIAEARDAGLPASRLRGLDLHTPTRGVRTLAPAIGLLERARAIASILPMGALISHESAAGILRLPLPRRLERPGADLHVTTPAGAPAIRRTGIIGHRGADLRCAVYRHGLALTSPTDTWLDLAPVLSVDQLVQLGDAIVFDDPESLQRLRDLVRGSRGIRGIVKGREALELIRPGSASPRETLVRLHLVRSGLPMPEMNVDVHDEHGQWVANVDFVWRTARVALEYDGGVHADPAQRWHDAQRRRQLSAAGWQVVVITKADVPARMADVVADLRALGV